MFSFKNERVVFFFFFLLLLLAVVPALHMDCRVVSGKSMPLSLRGCLTFCRIFPLLPLSLLLSFSSSSLFSSSSGSFVFTFHSVQERYLRAFICSFNLTISAVDVKTHKFYALRPTHIQDETRHSTLLQRLSKRSSRIVNTNSLFLAAAFFARLCKAHGLNVFPAFSF